LSSQDLLMFVISAVCVVFFLITEY